MTDFSKLADDITIKRTAAALENNGMKAIIVKNRNDAKKLVLGLIPKGAEIMTMTSETLEAISLGKEINESGEFNAVRPKLMKMDRTKQSKEMQKMGAAPEWVIGSVHAITEDGSIVIASASGSQLPAYAYGSSHVIWIAGSQKIVKGIDEAIKRIYEYVLPLEDARALKAYGIHSGVFKTLIINKEITPGRITMIIVKEKMGF